MPKNRRHFSYVDLFAGCGGLSLGLESAGGQLLAAVERSPMAAETFYRNLIDPEASDEDWLRFIQSDPKVQVQEGLVINDITSKTTFEAVSSQISGHDVDLVAGGPPCQGFSLAGRRQKDDKRNSLAWDFLRYVELANPKFVLIENVLGMNSKFKTQEQASDSVFNQLAVALAQTGSKYIVQKLHLNSIHFGAAQSRERLFLIGCRKDVSVSKGITATSGVWKSDFKDRIDSLPNLAPRPSVSSGRAATLRDALSDLLPGGHPSTYVTVLKDHKIWGLQKRPGGKNLTQRNHSVETILKFEIYLALKRHNLSPILLKDGLNEKEEMIRGQLRDELGSKLTFPILKSSGDVLAKSASEFDGLLEKFKTKKHSQRVLDLASTPPTVITSPDDYLHPLQPRVLSVRELARFQGFSDHFVFYSKETTGGLKRRSEVPQYSQVGNAVSPFVSRAFGELFSSLLA